MAGAFELLSALGFVAIFTLTFCRKKAWRRASWVGFGALGATTLLPAGGLLGPAAGALSVRPSGAPVSLPASRATAFALLTNAPNVISLAMLGLALWIGLLPGPHSVVATLVPGAAALGLVALGFSLAIRRAPAQSSAGVFRGRGFRGAIATLVLGAAHARELLKSKNWRLLGAPAYYLFDTAVLWATFEAFGHSPPLSIIGMAT